MSRAPNHRAPVVMLRSGHHGGLGIARSLGRFGVPVYSVDASRWETAFLSRYCRGRFVLDIENQPSDVAVDTMHTIARRVGGRPILMPTTDQACIWVAENSCALQNDFRFPVQDPG